MSLRDAIKAKHDAAEAHPLTAVMFSGQMTPAMYYTMLANQLVVYAQVESRAEQLGLLDDLPGLARSANIVNDVNELARVYDVGVLENLPCSAKHADHVGSLDAKGVLAHMYVIHMGDMYGGQMLKSKLPGSCTRYDFENRSALVAALRQKLTDDLADEANVAFDFTLEFFDALADKYHLRAAR